LGLEGLKPFPVFSDPPWKFRKTGEQRVYQTLDKIRQTAAEFLLIPQFFPTHFSGGGVVRAGSKS